LDRGIVILAQNSKDNYIDQAVALAMSVKKNDGTPVTLITNDEVSFNYQKYFDKILPIAWGDMAEDSEWKIDNRWKIFHQSPYKETIVLDTDMLILGPLDNLWNYYANYDLFFTTNPVTYRNENITSNYYRKIFVENFLPNIYSALYYFKKCEFAHNFFAYLELVIKNFDDFQNIMLDTKQEYLSIDVAMAMTVKLMDIESQVTNPKSNISKFVHMKSQIQNWNKPRDSWQNCISSTLTKDLNLYLGNYRQNTILHYTEKDFIYKHKVIEKFGDLNV